MSAIFVSHSSRDNAEADAMATWLKKQGHTSYFIDYDEKSGIRRGSDWEQVLYQRLRQCQAIRRRRPSARFWTKVVGKIPRGVKFAATSLGAAAPVGEHCLCPRALIDVELT
jgi:hypothetical protein